MYYHFKGQKQPHKLCFTHTKYIKDVKITSWKCMESILQQVKAVPKIKTLHLSHLFYNFTTSLAFEIFWQYHIWRGWISYELEDLSASSLSFHYILSTILSGVQGGSEFALYSHYWILSYHEYSTVVTAHIYHTSDSIIYIWLRRLI